jgi:hypothetical protein
MYFSGPGKAEGTRLACAYAGLELEDYRFRDRDEFIAMKESGVLRFVLRDTRHGYMCMLTDDRLLA